MIHVSEIPLAQARGSDFGLIAGGTVQTSHRTTTATKQQSHIFSGHSETSLHLLGSFISTEQRLVFKAPLKFLWNWHNPAAALVSVHLSLWNIRMQMPVLRSIFEQTVTTLFSFYWISLSACSRTRNTKTGTTVVSELSLCDSWTSVNSHTRATYQRLCVLTCPQLLNDASTIIYNIQRNGICMSTQQEDETLFFSTLHYPPHSESRLYWKDFRNNSSASQCRGWFFCAEGLEVRRNDPNRLKKITLDIPLTLTLTKGSLKIVVSEQRWI